MSHCGDGSVRVVQMTACQVGWQAVFRTPKEEFDHGAHSAFVVPIACWLLVEHDGEMHVHPTAMLGDAVRDVTEAENYLGIISPGESLGEFMVKRRLP